MDVTRRTSPKLVPREHFSFVHHLVSLAKTVLVVIVTVPVRYSLVYVRETKHGGRETRWDLLMPIKGKLHNILP